MALKAENFYFVFLFIFFVFSDLLKLHIFSNVLKFIFILSISLWTLKNKKCRSLRAALLLTSVCDFFLLFTPYYSFGVFLFSIVMCFYISMFSEKHKFHIFSIAVNSVFLFSDFRLYLLCITYALLFYANLFVVTKRFIKAKPIIPAAFILFAVCDVFVALSFLSGISALQNFVWLFYAPSQYLISHCATK